MNFLTLVGCVGLGELHGLGSAHNGQGDPRVDLDIVLRVLMSLIPRPHYVCYVYIYVSYAYS